MRTRQGDQPGDYEVLNIPSSEPYGALKEDAQRCTACPLYKKGTQTVFGEGPLTADLFFVGEQPGNEEDKQGRPFVGPAGKLFSEALQLAEIRREEVYLTNAVKHFKWEPKGKLRVHQKPIVAEVKACKPWLLAEIERVSSSLIVALGATAAQSLIGKAVQVTKERRTFVEGIYSAPIFITIHPSAILRIPDPTERQSAFEEFVQDLLLARRFAQKKGLKGEERRGTIQPLQEEKRL